jgi:nicotinamidase-related amidase
MSTCVVTIDFINDLVHPDGKLAASAAWVAAHDVLANVARLTTWARARGDAVIHVGLALQATESALYARSPLLRAVWEKQACVAESWGAAFHDALVVAPDDLVLRKNRVSAFAGSGLEAMLRERGIDDLILCGVSTDMTIVSTGRQAHDLDFAVTIARNACGAASDENHRLGIAAMTRLAQVENLP